MSLQENKEKLQLIMERKEAWVMFWMYPSSALNEYEDYDNEAFNIVIVGVSGHGK